MERSLSKDRWDLLRTLAKQAETEQVSLYIVGGAVRDLLLGRQLKDFDFVVEGKAIALAHSLAAKHGGSVTAHSRFGTAKWFLPPGLKTDHDTLDLISARSETYQHPAALPTVKLGNLGDDLRRRDFTINALAVRLDGAHFGDLRDDLHGAEDLESGIIRVLHSRSFIDDPTRMYRAARYEGRYRFRIAEETLALIPEARSLVDTLSAQRIRHELDLVLEEPGLISILKRLDELDLLDVIHPSLANFGQSNLATAKLDHVLLQNRNARWLLWLMHLEHQEIETLNERLHFPAELLKTLHGAVSLNTNLTGVVGLPTSKAVEFLESYPIRAIEVIALVVQDPEIKKILNEYLSDWRHVKPKTSGHDLKRRGIAPGPKYAEILRRLRAAWLDKEIKNEEEERNLLNHLLEEA